jgi:AraC-like DNA-binding protein
MPTVQNAPSISTILTPDERSSLDAAGRGLCEALHRDSIDEVTRDVRERRAAAVVVSVARCVRETMNVTNLMREFPRIPAIALLSITGPAASNAVLSLGQCGIRTLIDVRAPDGWSALRQAIASSSPTESGRFALDVLAVDLAGVSVACWSFFEALFSTTPPITRVSEVARHLDLRPFSLASRLYRLRLPAARTYLSLSRLTRAARLLENPGLAIVHVSNILDYSSPQAFGRHIGLVLGMTASTFRQTYDGPQVLELFRQTLIAPHIDRLRRFDPR